MSDTQLAGHALHTWEAATVCHSQRVQTCSNLIMISSPPAACAVGF